MVCEHLFGSVGRILQEGLFDGLILSQIVLGIHNLRSYEKSNNISLIEIDLVFTAIEHTQNEV